MYLPMAKSAIHSNDSVRRPGAKEEEENSECNLGYSHFNASLFVLIRYQGFDVHLLGLNWKQSRINCQVKQSSRVTENEISLIRMTVLQANTGLFLKHLFVAAHGIYQLHVEVDDEGYRCHVGPSKNRGYKNFRVLIVTQKVEAAGRQKSLCMHM